MKYVIAGFAALFVPILWVINQYVSADIMVEIAVIILLSASPFIIFFGVLELFKERVL